VERHDEEQEDAEVHELDRPADQRAGGFGQQGEAGRRRRHRPRQRAAQQPVEQQGAEGEQRHVDRRDEARVREDERAERLVVELE
jgi:hypothetical protein